MHIRTRKCLSHICVYLSKASRRGKIILRPIDSDELTHNCKEISCKIMEAERTEASNDSDVNDISNHGTTWNHIIESNSTTVHVFNLQLIKPQVFSICFESVNMCMYLYVTMQKYHAKNVMRKIWYKLNWKLHVLFMNRFRVGDEISPLDSD